MRLSALFAGREITGDFGPDPEVARVAYDSRLVAPGDLFIAWRGERQDGRRFAAAAIERGAVAVVADGEPPVPLAVPWLVAAEPRALAGPLAARLAGYPDRALTLVAVTGTNGKSTVTALVAQQLEAAGRPCGLVGTLGHRFRGEVLPGGERTTPEGSDLIAALAAVRDRGGLAVALEASSHALAQGRLAGVSFDVGAFLNLTRDHLDFHGDFEHYFEAKASLFDRLKTAGTAVVNLDDAWGRKLAERLPAALGFGAGGAVSLRAASLETRGTRAVVATPRGELSIESRLLGRLNLDNLLAAAAIGEALALPPQAIAEGLAALAPLPGRMEPVDLGQAFPVLVDYAHTEAALAAALGSLRELGAGKLIVVFGCGGDRDPGKRAPMGEVAGRLADLPIATSDNPRSEDPMAILAAVEEGLKASGNPDYRVVPDRREAIRRAIAVGAARGWAVLVAGKGHERDQIVGGERLPFSDREEIEQALAERRLASGAGG